MSKTGIRAKKSFTRLHTIDVGCLDTDSLSLQIQMSIFEKLMSSLPMQLLQ